MQALSLCFRRLYVTTALPDAAAAARTASTPRAVRLRRLRKRPAIRHGDSDATDNGLTPTDHATYHRLKSAGVLKDRKEGAWLEHLNHRRTRIRGVRQIPKAGGGYNIDVVGQKIYLPNIIFRFVRNNTPAGQPYNPYEATFRIPQSLTKTDIRSYLAAVYGVKTTYIRTDNYLAPIVAGRAASFVPPKSYRTYKRAVVGLVDPFYYPLDLAAMDEKDRKARTEWINEKFQVEREKHHRKYEQLQLTKSSGDINWKWRGSIVLKRSAILKKVAERRALREDLVSTEVKSIRDSRAKGQI